MKVAAYYFHQLIPLTLVLNLKNNRLKDKLILLLRYHQLIHVLKTQLNKVF